jgi:hypothetical protein
MMISLFSIKTSRLKTWSWMTKWKRRIRIGLKKEEMETTL